MKEVYRGGKYRNRSTVFELLKSIDIDVPEKDRYDPYFVTYDFEAYQKVIDDTAKGRKLVSEHVPATVSICSNVPGHTDPEHIASTGDPQELADNFVKKLLEVQETRERVLTQDFEEVLDTLDIYCTEAEAQVRGLKPPEEGEETRHEEQEEEEEEEVSGGGEEDVEIGQKRKRKSKNTSTKRQCFLDTDAEVDGQQTSEDEEDDDDDVEDSEMDDFIDSSNLEEDEACFYRRVDNLQQQQQDMDVQETEGEEEETGQAAAAAAMISADELYTLAERRWRWGKSIRSKFLNYIKQITVIGFNSQKYDIPLIRPYLPSSIIKFDGNPKLIIKKLGGYMCISSDKLKFLDITNYLAANTSLKKFYASYNVSTPKEAFPYEWFDSLDKLDYPGLPPSKECFKSILTKNSTISDEEFQACKDIWEREGFTTFRDWVKFYNNADVIGFVEAVQKMIEYEKEVNGLDMFKDSVSLPGLTQRYLFKRLAKLGSDYFVSFSEIHKDVLKYLRESLTGGPSIIFHRYQERLKTWIKGKYLCKKVIGFDANSLYLYCLGKQMCTGFYSILEKCNGYKRSTPFSHQSIQWLEYLNRTEEEGVRILHGKNVMEVRIGNHMVDGYDPRTKTAYEFYGCYWHGHSCQRNYDPVKWNKLIEREKVLLQQNGIDHFVSIWSCEWAKNPESKKKYREAEDVKDLTMDDILEEIKADRIFGLITLDIHVPPGELTEKFSEFPPIFKNSEITLADVGDHMQEYCRSVSRKTGVKRSLISSMKGKNITILTPLLKKYLELGLEVTNIERVIEYNPKPVFEWFVEEVSKDRRRADLGGAEYEMRGAQSKLKGNCGYGRTLMDKTTHTKVLFTKEENLPIHAESPFLKSFDELNERIYEVEKSPKKIVHDLPVQIGLAVYSYAKQHMLEFWDFLNSHLDNDKYQLMEMDTDSLYIAFAEDSIDDCVKADKKADWFKKKWEWFSSEDREKMVEFEGESITYAQWDQRTPGKFKAEFQGDGMVCLNSKVYTIWIDEKSKTSCKGTQQKRNDLLKEDFFAVLHTQKSHSVENAGFIKENGCIKTYIQNKVGMGYFYGKRKVLDDGVSTTHLDI